MIFLALEDKDQNIKKINFSNIEDLIEFGSNKCNIGNNTPYVLKDNVFYPFVADVEFIKSILYE